MSMEGWRSMPVKTAMTILAIGAASVLLERVPNLSLDVGSRSNFNPAHKARVESYAPYEPGYYQATLKQCGFSTLDPSSDNRGCQYEDDYVVDAAFRKTHPVGRLIILSELHR